jgi:hypothetical protein
MDADHLAAVTRCEQRHGPFEGSAAPASPPMRHHNRGFNSKVRGVSPAADECPEHLAPLEITILDN